MTNPYKQDRLDEIKAMYRPLGEPDGPGYEFYSARHEGRRDEANKDCAWLIAEVERLRAENNGLTEQLFDVEYALMYELDERLWANIAAGLREAILCCDNYILERKWEQGIND